MRSLDDIAQFLAARFADLVAEHKVPGAAVAVLKDGEIIDAAAGVLSTSTRVDVTTDSVFQIGSITKVWTATLVMQLVDEGLLDLDAPDPRYLPEFRLAGRGRGGIHHDATAAQPPGRLRGRCVHRHGRGDDAIEKYVGVIAGVPQLFTPGELFSYNNVGFSVLGRLVEVLRGKSWEQALVDHIVDAARTHPRRSERLRGDPVPRRRRARRPGRGRRRGRRPVRGRSPDRTNRRARCWR